MADIREEIRKTEGYYNTIVLTFDFNASDGDKEFIIMYVSATVNTITYIIINQDNYKTETSTTRKIEVIKRIITQNQAPNSDKFIELLTYLENIRNTIVPKGIKGIEKIATIIQDLKWVINWFKDYIQIYAPPLTPDTFYNSKNSAFTYCLKYLRVQNYQSLKNIEISNIPIDSRFIVFTGDNAHGKTSILQAISLGMFGGDLSSQFYGQKGTLISLDAQFQNKNIYNYYLISNIYKNEEQEFFGIEKNPNFIAYGASRLQLQSSESQDNAKLRQSNIYGIFRADSILLNIEYWFKIQQLKGKTERIEAVKKLLIELMPSISEIRFENPEDSDEYLIKYIENGVALKSDQLSAGNKSILAMIGDMLIRLYRTQPKVIEPKELVGIVAIDELETHLHPKWQKEFPRLLATCFPRIQFIVTTHSAIVFLGMPSNSTFFNISRDENNETTVRELKIDIKNLLPNQILTSPIFDLESIKSVANTDLKEVRLEDDYQEIIKRDEVRQNIAQLLAKKYKNQD